MFQQMFQSMAVTPKAKAMRAQNSMGKGMRMRSWKKCFEGRRWTVSNLCSLVSYQLLVLPRHRRQKKQIESSVTLRVHNVVIIIHFRFVADLVIL